MSQPQDHPSNPTSQPNNAAQTRTLLTNTALFALIACPALALLPPRKLDTYTFGLIGLTGFSANFVTQERTGKSITQHLGLTAAQPLQTVAGASQQQVGLGEKGQPLPLTIQQRMGLNEGGGVEKGRGEESGATGPVSEEVQSQRAAWKVQRDKDIKEEVEEGKGFGDMIVDQVWEVWNWGKPKKDDDE